MKKFAKITDKVIINVANFPDQEKPPKGWIDVTGKTADIGWPVNSEGAPVAPPSKYHTVMDDGQNGVTWGVSDDDVQREIEDAHRAAICGLKINDACSIRSIREFIVKKFSDDPDLPSFLKAYEEKALHLRKSIQDKEI